MYVCIKQYLTVSGIIAEEGYFRFYKLHNAQYPRHIRVFWAHDRYEATVDSATGDRVPPHPKKERERNLSLSMP
jgi:hypothetical protein